MLALPLFAQAAASYSIAQMAIGLIIVIAVIACVVVFVQQSGVAIPPIVVKLFWIVLAAVVAIVAIRFLCTL